MIITIDTLFTIIAIVLIGMTVCGLILLFWWARKIRVTQKQGSPPAKYTSYVLFVACCILITAQIASVIFSPIYQSYSATKIEQQHRAATATVMSVNATANAQGQATMAAKITATAQAIHHKNH